MSNSGEVSTVTLNSFNQFVPRVFAVETVLGCNLKCPECAVGAGIITRKKGWMTFEQFKIIADKIRPFCEYLYLHLWGEPLLNKDIYRIIKYASAFTKTNIHTNGNSLTEEKAERLITSGVTDISVSIDGVSQEVYEQYRKGGFVIKALWSLAKLKELNLKYGNRVNVRAQFVVFKHNQHEMDSFREFCQSLDVKPVYKAPYIRSGSQYENSDKPEYARLSYPDIALLRQAMSVDCKNPREVFTILLDGTCVMCCYDHNGITNYGNIYEQDVLDIWNSPKYRKDRWDIVTGNAPKFCIENCLRWTLKATTPTTETDLTKALRSRIESKPEPKVTTDSEAEKAWVDYRVRFRKAILEDDITDFMNWEVIKSTIYQGPPREEFEFLRNLPTWSEFRNALYESFVGNPMRYPLYPLSTGNQIHQAYTLAQLTETGGCPVNDLPQIVEFGGGFGSMCKLIHKLGFKGRYIIFDLPELSAMQEYYLKAVGIKTEVKIDEVTENESCVVLLSDIEQFKRQLEIPAESFAFIAVWSLSETPVDFRNQICDLVSNASYYLIAYQDYFRDATNLDYFAKLPESKSELAWHNYPIGHFPEHNYLIGTKNADKRQAQAGDANRNMLIEAAMKKPQTMGKLKDAVKCEVSGIDKDNDLKFSFVMIVLNGMPFIEYSLKSIYDFAHEIIIVEGAVEKCMFAANPDGGSTDGTVEFIKSFPDPENKIRIVQGRWPEKCEMQNEALKYVTGDYVWLIDSDEVYKRKDLEKVKTLVQTDSSITQINFNGDNFWKGLDYIFVSHKFFETGYHWRRVFKFVKGAVFTTHRPPTMLWPGSSRTTEQMHLVDGNKTRKMGIIPHHYSYVLDKQVKQKVELYRRYNWSRGWGIDLNEWYNECFLKWTPGNRQEIDSKYPIWTGDINSRTIVFTGTHPEVMEDFKKKLTQKTYWPEAQTLSVIGDTYYQKKVVEAWNLIEIDVPVQQRKNLMIQNVEQGRPFWNIHVALAFLADRLRPVDYLEIGVRIGCSLVPVLHNSSVEEVVAVDKWAGSYGSFPNTLEYTIEQINKYKAKTNKQFKIKFIKGDSHKKLKELIHSGKKFDLITVDGDHTEGGACEDLEDAAKLLADKGAIVFDDIIHPSHLYLKKLVDRFQLERPEYNVLINSTQDNGCVIFLKNIDVHRLLSEEPVEIAEQKTKCVKVAADYVGTGMKVNAESSFGQCIQKLFASIRPRKIIETGTYLGTGTTTIIAKSLEALGIDDTIFYTIEVNPQSYSRAKHYFDTNNIRVNALNGLSVPRSMLPSREQIARKTIMDIDYDGIFVDHRQENRVELYYNETNFPDVPDNLLGKCLIAIDFKPDFVLLDSGGHMGGIEFNYLIDNLKGECYIALDDIYHVKHHHSFNQIQNDERFELVVHSEEKFGFCIARFTPRKELIETETKNILWVRPDSIGDNVLSASMLPYIRQKYKDARITVACQEYLIEFYQACPLVDNTIGINKSRAWRDEAYRREIVSRLRTLRPGLSLNSVHSRTSLTDLLAVNCGAGRRIAFEGNLCNISAETKHKHDRFYTKLLASDGEHKSEIERHRDFLHGLGIDAALLKPMVWTTAEDEKFADGLIRKHNLNPDKTIALFAGAQHEYRLYEKYGTALSEFCKKNRLKVIALGTDQDCNINQSNLDATGVETVNLSGQTTILQSAAILKRCKLAVGAETGLAHISCAVGTPNVILLGGGHFGRFMPYSPLTSVVCLPLGCFGCNWKCRYERPYCVKDIAPKVIAEALRQTFERPSKRIRVFIQGNSLRESTQDQPAWKMFEGFLDVNNIDVISVEADINIAAGCKGTLVRTQKKTGMKQNQTDTHESRYLVTSVVSTYNAERFIRGCLEDLENQTIADRLEIIVVNSGSKQNEEAIVKEFQKSYDNIKYIKTEERETIYKAWNRAIKIASGRYITNANTDDRHTKDALEKMAKALGENPDKVLVYANQILTNEIDGKRIISGQRVAGKYSRSRLLDREAVVGSQPMWRRKVHDEFGYFDKGFFIGGDDEFWLRISTKYDFLYLDETLGDRLVADECVSAAGKELSDIENYFLCVCYSCAPDVSIEVDSRGISKNPVFSDWPEINLWKRKVKAKLTGKQISMADNIKDSWDYRTNPGPKLTVVIVAYNRHTELLENLHTLNQQTRKDFEVIVVNNGGELSVLQRGAEQFQYGLCVIELKDNLGPSPARNIGAEFARAEYIAFLDDDAVADKDFVKNIIAHFNDYNICGLRGKVLPKTGDYKPDFYDLGDEIIAAACLPSAFSAFRKDVLVKVGGFNELLFGFEGVELSYKIYEAQKEKIKSIMYFPDVVVHHDCAAEGPAYNLKKSRRKYMEQLARKKHRQISGYAKLMRSLCPGKEGENDYYQLMGAASFLQERHPEEALEWTQKAAKVNPDAIACRYTLGSLHTRLERYDDAQVVFEKILEQLSKALEKGDMASLSSDFKDSTTVGLCYLDTCLKLATCYTKQGSYGKAKRIYIHLLDNPYLAMSEQQKNCIHTELAKLDETPPVLAVAEKRYDVSIVLCTKDRAELLDQMLDSMEKAAKGLTYEVIAIEGDSGDNSLEILRKHNVTKIYSEAECLGPGRHSWPQLYNFGFSKASGKWGMYASDDIVFSEGSICRAVEFLQEQKDEVAGGIFFYRNTYPTSRGWEQYGIDFTYGSKLLMNYGLFRMKYYREVGGLNEQYRFYCADTDLCLALYENGRQLIPLADCLVTHNNILDVRKKANADMSGRDIALCLQRWKHFVPTEIPAPRRLIWQEELRSAFNLPAELEKINSGIESFWYALACFQEGLFQKAEENFIRAVKAHCDHWQVLWELANSAGQCGNMELAEKAAEKVVKLAPAFSEARDFLIRLSRNTQSASNRTIRKNIVGLIFSKDRAMQLQAAIDSFLLHCGDGGDDVELCVLYKASNQLHRRQYDKLKEKYSSISFIEEADFKKQTLAVIDKFEYVLFLVDDNLFVRDFCLADIVKSLCSNNDAIGFSLRLGGNTDYCYARNASQGLPEFQPAGNGILKYDWTKSEFDFGYPFEVSSSVYRTKDIRALLAEIKFDNPNMLEGLMAANVRLYSQAGSRLFCYEHSVTFCNPVNMVQSVSSNRVGGDRKYSAQKLAEMFDDGFEVDVSRYSGFVPNSCHQEVELEFCRADSAVKSDKPLVSVEMVTYNAERFIRRAIDSVLAQSYQNFELVVVDDGSADGAREIVSSYSDSRIRYIYTPHKNCASARNKAISEASGKYLLCVDSDDFIAPDYIEKMVACAEKHLEIDYFYPDKLVLVGESGEPTGRQWEYLDFSNNKTLPAFLFEQGYAPIPNPGSLKRRSLFDKVGRYEDLDTVEDFVFLCKNVLKIRFKRVEEHSTYFYRKIASGLSQKFRARDQITAMALNEMVAIYPPELLCPNIEGITDPSLRKAEYYKYLFTTFYKHAQGYHLVQYGEYFQQYGDYYRQKLLNITELSTAAIPAGRLSG